MCKLALEPTALVDCISIHMSCFASIFDDMLCCFLLLLYHLSAVSVFQACFGLLYQAVPPRESMKPWSSGTMTSLATLGKVCASFLEFHWKRNALNLLL